MTKRKRHPECFMRAVEEDGEPVIYIVFDGVRMPSAASQTRRKLERG